MFLSFEELRSPVLGLFCVAPVRGKHRIRFGLHAIDVYGNVHGEHPECETSTNRRIGMEPCGAAYEPRKAEDDRPRDDDPDYVYEEREALW
jgi:hypothetical protein